MRSSLHRFSATTLFAIFLLGGCATASKNDPLEPVNRGIYQFNDSVDRAVLKPVAQGYKDVVPDIVRTGISNFFSNLDDVLVLLNDLLQFKLPQAASDFSRLGWNSTVGIAGLIDVATPMGLDKHDEDFGQTLGYWGVGNGPYLVLPFLGPSTVRDTAGLAVDAKADVVYNADDVPTRNTAVGVKAVSTRANYLGAENVLQEAAIDPYVFLREAYLQRRRTLIHDGNSMPDEEDDEDIPAPAPKAAPQP